MGSYCLAMDSAVSPRVKEVSDHILTDIYSEPGKPGPAKGSES